MLNFDAFQTQVFFPLLKTSHAWARQPSTSEIQSVAVSSSSSSLAVEPWVVGPSCPCPVVVVVEFPLCLARPVEVASSAVVGGRPSCLVVPLVVAEEVACHHLESWRLWKTSCPVSSPWDASWEVAVPSVVVEEDLRVAQEEEEEEGLTLEALALATCAW
jgi:hypothetical protein